MKLFWLGILVWCFTSTVLADDQLLLTHCADVGTFTNGGDSSIIGGEGCSDTNGDDIMPTDGVFRTLRVIAANSPASAPGATVGLTVGNVFSALTCILPTAPAGTPSSCCNIRDTVSVSAGDTVHFRYIPDGPPFQDVAPMEWSLLFTPSAPDQMILHGGTGSTAFFGGGFPAQNAYAPIHGQNGPQFTLVGYAGHLVLPTSGTIKNLYVNSILGAPGFETTTFTVMKNDVDTTLTCDSFDGFNCSDTTHSIGVVAGDTMALHLLKVGGASPQFTHIGLVFVPTISGEFLIATSTPDVNLDPSNTTYVPIARGTDSATTTESDNLSITQACTISKLYVLLNGTPDTGVGTQSYSITLRKNNVDTSITCTVSEADSTCQDSTNALTLVTDNDILDYKVVPTGTPTAVKLQASLVGSHCTGPVVPCGIRRVMITQPK